MTENSPKLINHPESLEVYPIAFDTAMTIFEVSQKFPQAKKSALIAQIRLNVNI